MVLKHSCAMLCCAELPVTTGGVLLPLLAPLQKILLAAFVSATGHCDPNRFNPIGIINRWLLHHVKDLSLLFAASGERSSLRDLAIISIDPFASGECANIQPPLSNDGQPYSGYLFACVERTFVGPPPAAFDHSVFCISVKRPSAYSKDFRSFFYTVPAIWPNIRFATGHPRRY